MAARLKETKKNKAVARKTATKKSSKLSFADRFERVQLLILDVDGVLTDGKLFWVQNQGWARFFNVQDGYGIRLLQKAGMQLAVFSGSKGADIQERMKNLGINHVYLGNEKKLQSLAALQRVTDVALENMAYIGDDLYDIPVMNQVGLAVSVPNGCPLAKKTAYYVTQAKGGEGAVREVADLILAAKGTFAEQIVEQLDFERNGEVQFNVDRSQAV